MVLAACALFDTNTDITVCLCLHYDQSGVGLVYIANGLPRLGKPIRDEDIKEWLRVVFGPNPEEDDYLEYFHQINIGLSMVTPSHVDHAGVPEPSLPIMVQHKNLPFKCTCHTFWNSSICHHSLSVADLIERLSLISLNEMIQLVYINNPGALKRPGCSRKIHTRHRYKQARSI
jgi:hypothetical protein